MPEKRWKEEYCLILIECVKANKAIFDANEKNPEVREAAWAEAMKTDPLKFFALPDLKNKWKTLVARYRSSKKKGTLNAFRHELQFLDEYKNWYLSDTGDSESESGSSSPSPKRLRPTSGADSSLFVRPRHILVESFCNSLKDPLQLVFERNHERFTDLCNNMQKLVDEVIEIGREDAVSTSSGISSRDKVKKWLSDISSDI